MSAVLATTTFSPIYDLRARLAIKMLVAARDHGYPVVVVDGGSDPRYRHDMERLGAHVVDEVEHPRGVLGPGRRQAMGIAGQMAGAGGVVIWTEPERESLISQLGPLVEAVRRGADLALPYRQSMDSYPWVQAYYEGLDNLLARHLTGLPDLDLVFGPMALGTRGLQRVLAYDDRYGGKWDSIIAPRLPMIFDPRIWVVGVPVNFILDPEQKAAEEGDPELDEKRRVQAINTITVIARIWEELTATAMR